jgi:predicted alpha-1,2-mannosidase
MKTIIPIILFWIGTTHIIYSQYNPVDYVDPFIGTAFADVGPKDMSQNFITANVYPGAVFPWGMVSASPHNDVFYKPDSPSCTNIPGSSYIHGSPYIYGFGQLHLSGVGCYDFGNFMIIPSASGVKGNFDDYRTTYSREKASPGYYSISLDDKGIDAEMTVTIRTTVSRFTFSNATDSAIIAIDLARNQLPSDEGYIRIVSNNEIEGWNRSGGFCGSETKQQVFFVAKLNKDAFEFGTTRNNQIAPEIDVQVGKNIGGYFILHVSAKESVLVKLGISFVSIENARINLETENPGWDFGQIHEACRNAWEKQLSKILIQDTNEVNKTIFYTALYRALIHPSIYEDCNGEYRAMGNKEVRKLQIGQQHQYTVFSLWDTYRNLHQLLTLVYPEVQIDLVKTMINQYVEGGYLPKWELASNESYVMVGDPAACVIADTYLKGITGFNVALAYKAMLKSAENIPTNTIRPGIEAYIKFGFIPYDYTGEWVWGPTSTSLEYYFADYAIAQLARSLNKLSDFKRFHKRSLGFIRLYDEETGFLRPRNTDGSWLTPFNCDTIRGSIPGAEFPNGGPGYVEGNAWQYNFMVPDVPKLVEAMGKDRFIQRLEDCFKYPNRFVLFNEPDMAYPYLFNFVEGQEWQTQCQVWHALNTYFSNSYGGLPGNDDCGTLSSWFIFSSLGLYPAQPANNIYQLTSPLFKKTIIKLNPDFYSGSELVIDAPAASEKNIYIKSIRFRNQKYRTPAIDHLDLVKGGTLKLELGPMPEKL